MGRKIAIAFLILTFSVVFSGCIGGDGTTFEGNLEELLIGLDDLPLGWDLDGSFIESDFEPTDEMLETGFKESININFEMRIVRPDHITYDRFSQSVARYDIDTVEDKIYGMEGFLIQWYSQWDEYTVETISNPDIGEGAVILKIDNVECDFQEYVMAFYRKDIIMVFQFTDMESIDLQYVQNMAENMSERI